MSAGSKKRKRNDTGADRPPKFRAVEEGASIPDAKSRGQSRQAKSERRSKKAAKAASNASLLSQKGNLSKSEPELLTSTPSKQDNLANGEDFVSLSVDSEIPLPAPKSSSKHAPSQTPQQKPKSNSTPAPATSTTDTAKPKSNKDRFILFVGNLPYAATTPTITAHFRTLQPFTVRHSTNKTTGRSKGFAFLEFESFDKMKTCLKLYHHSIFDPDNPTLIDEGDEPEDDADERQRKPARSGKDNGKPDRPKSKNARRINVELTAGGGGKGKQRKDRIEQKNKKLAAERESRHIKDAAEKAKAAQEKKERPATGANADEEKSNDQRGNIHPSRLKRVRH